MGSYEAPGAMRLRGWKEIARHLRVDERTVRRWEKRGLPIHRLPGDGRSVVFADPADLDQWIVRHGGSSKDGAGDGSGRSRWISFGRSRRHWLLAGVAAVAVGSIVIGWVGGPFRRTSVPARQQSVRSTHVDAAKLQNARGTAEGFRRAIALTTEALAEDPQDAAAYAELAFAYIRLPEQDASADRQACYERAQKAAQRALDLDPSSWRAHSTMGFIEYGYHWNFIAGIRHFREVIRLNPNRGPGHNQLGLALLNMGDTKGALSELALSTQLEANSPIYRAFYAEAQYVAGNRKAAVATWKQILADNPKLTAVRALVADDALASGDLKGAIAQNLQVARERGDQRAISKFQTAGRALSSRGPKAMLGVLLKEALSNEEATGHFEVARLYSVLGDNNASLQALRKALDAREPDALTMRNDPLLIHVRQDPRFEQLANSFGITPSSAEAGADGV